MNQTKKEKIFDDWLSNHQSDFVKIVNKYRASYHPLSVEDIISEINLGLLKKKEYLINGEKALSNYVDFQKVAYAYARNYIAWTADGVTNKDKKYLNNRKDGIVNDEDDGEMSLFDFICQTLGEDDKFFKELDRSEKFQNIFKWIFEYSHFLNPHQKNILQLILEGHQFNKIAELTNVTHQAISAMAIEIFDNIKSHIKVDVRDSNSDSKIISEGHASINHLFGEKRFNQRKINTKLLYKILNTIESNPKRYTFRDLSKMTQGILTPKQICAYVCRNRKHFLIKKLPKRKAKQE